MAFEVDFVDSLGQTAYAEELDVRVTRVLPLPLPSSPIGAARRGEAAGAGASGEADGDGGVDDSSAAEDAAKAAALEERTQSRSTLRLALKKGVGLDSADLNGKSDPYVVITVAGQVVKSQIKPKSARSAARAHGRTRARPTRTQRACMRAQPHTSACAHIPRARALCTHATRHKL